MTSLHSPPQFLILPPLCTCFCWGHSVSYTSILVFCRKLFVFEQQLLFRVDSLCDLGFSALSWCKHHALITRVDKPSLAQGGPYPTLLPYPTLPYPTALPYPTLYPTLPYPTLPLPYPTLPTWQAFLLKGNLI